MITEDDLRDLLSQAADAAPPPGAAPDDLLAAIAQEQAPRVGGGGRRPRWRDWRPRSLSGLVPVAAAVLVALLTVGFLAAGGRDADRPSLSSGELDPKGPGASTTVALDEHGTSAEYSYGDERLLRDGQASSIEAVGTAGGSGASAPTPGEATTSAGSAQAEGSRVVRTGAIHLQLEEGTFDRAAERITATVIGLGGYVADAQTGRDGEVPTGSIVVRVPAAAYDPLASEVRSLGEVAGETTKATEVTAQFTDLEARLAAQVATRDRLGAVLAEAATVSDILTVQDRITAVQTEIERLQGELRVLEDQTTMATLAVTLAEPGADPPELRSTSADDGRDLGGAWADARRRFGNGVEALVAWSGVAALLVVLAAVALAFLRFGWPRLRRLLL